MRLWVIVVALQLDDGWLVALEEITADEANRIVQNTWSVFTEVCLLQASQVAGHRLMKKNQDEKNGKKRKRKWLKKMI